MQQDLDAGTLEFTEEVDDIYLGTDESIRGALAGYTNQGVLDESDLGKLIEFGDAIDGLGFVGSMSLVNARGLVGNWMQNHGVSVVETPVSYHAISVLTEALLQTQVTRLQQDGKLTIPEKGADNNTLCTATGNFCGTNATVSQAAQAALGVGVRETFRQTTNWTALQQDAAATAVVFLITTFISKNSCKNLDCDDCGPAAGIRAVYSGCTFTGIQPVGSFEFAEQVNYSIDKDQDGFFETSLPARVMPGTAVGFVPKAALPSTPFKVYADVLCDGGLIVAPGSIMPWPGTKQSPVYVDPKLSVAPPRPTANFTQPPLLDDAQSNGYPYFYPTNTQLCFGMTNLALRGWTFVGWGTVDGNPSSSKFTSSFCIKYSNTQPIFKSVYAEFSHPCSSTNYKLSGPSFVVKPQ